MAWRWLLLLSLAALLQCGISQQSQRERERQQQRGETDPYYLMGWGNGRLRLEGDELGCPRSFNGCHCNYTEAPMALRPHRILNCSARALQKLPDFSRLVGYRFDQVLLDRNNISRLPKNAFMGVNIGLMNLTSNPLRSVADAAFAGARGIHSLLLGNCTLGSAPMAIGHLVNLTWLDLHNNSISRPTKEVFQPLLKLQHLDMSFNRRLELPSPFVSFNNLTKLLSLNLSSCGLSSLPTQALTRMRLLRRLILRNNTIQMMARDAFVGMRELQELDLYGNPVQLQGSLRLFKGLDGLEVLRLADCKAEEIGQSFFQDLKNLTTLQLANCSVQVVGRRAFTVLKNLTHLDLSLNRNLQVAFELFEGLERRLEELSLRYMGLVNYPTPAVEHLWRLRKIDLGYNLITSLDKGSFHGLIGRRPEINLEGNKIKFISSYAFYWLYGPVKVNLRDNYIDNLDWLLAHGDCYYHASTFLLADNGINCNCDIYRLAQQKSVDIVGAQCDSPKQYRGLVITPGYGLQAGQTCLEQDWNATRACAEEDRRLWRFYCPCNRWTRLGEPPTCRGVAGSADTPHCVMATVWMALLLIYLSVCKR